MTIHEISTALRAYRAPGAWMRFFASDEIAQEIAFAEWRYPTPEARAIAVRYAMRKLRHEIGSQMIDRAPKVPSALRASKQKFRTGYRANPEAKRTARAKVPAARRKEIAHAGAIARRAKMLAR